MTTANTILTRFLSCTGFYPQKALGTKIPNSFGSVSGRSSQAYLDKVDNDGYRKLYKVGDNWLRFVDRSDSEGTRIKGYLAEAEAENLCLRSEDMDTTWTKIDGGDTIGGSVEAPNKETITTAGIIADATDGQHGVTQDITLTADTYTFSVFAKAGRSTWLYLIDTTSGDGSYYNLSTGVLGTAQGGATAYIESWGDSWYRCGFQTAGTVAAHTFEVSPAGGDGDNTVVGNSSDVDVFIFGAQCELSEYMSSYIPTTSAAATREPDLLQYKADDGNVKNNQRGTFVCEFLKELYNLPSDNYMFSLSDGGTAADRIVSYIDDSAGYISGLSAASAGSAGSLVSAFGGASNLVTDTRYTWKTDDFKQYINGGLTKTDAAMTPPDDIDRIDIGTDNASAGQFGGVIGNIKIYSFPTLKQNPSAPAGLVLYSNQTTALNTTTIKTILPAGNSATIYWGDGTSTVMTADGTLRTYTHDYTNNGMYGIRLTGDKAAITRLDAQSQAWVSGNVSNLSGFTGLTYLSLGGTSVSGNISNLSGLTSLTYLKLYGTSVLGDISNLSGLTSLTYLHLGDTSVSGNISNLSGFTGLTYLHLGDTSVSGNISNLSGLTSLTYLSLGDTSVSGNVSNLSGLTGLAYLYLNNISLSYTTTTLPPWASCNIRMYTTGFDSSEVDQFLIDLADGVGAGGTLNIAGTNAARTSASDAAKATLLGAGWAVTVNE